MKIRTDEFEAPLFTRVFPEGDVVAIWHDGSEPRGMSSSYQQVGQHSLCSAILRDELTPATPKQEAPLLRELERIGYTIVR